MAMGEAAGLAASMAALEQDGNVDLLDIFELKQRLAKQGAVVPGINDFFDFNIS